MNPQTKLAVGLLVAAMALGCSDGDRNQLQLPPQKLQAQLRLFQPYALDEYTLVEHDFLPGLGGRWLTVRYRLKVGYFVDRSAIRLRIVVALAQDGWSPAPPPGRDYVLTKIFETAENDLYFSHPARQGDREHVFYNQAVHVSQDASVLVGYYEVGW